MYNDANTGIGNSVNAIVSLLQLYNLPIIFLISYRGTLEKIGAQVGMAKITKDIFKILNIPVLHCSSENDIEQIIIYKSCKDI